MIEKYSHTRNKSLKNIKGEVWRDIYRYEAIYKISNLGRVKSSYGKGRILLACIAREGYFRHLLCVNGKVKGLYTHRLIAIAFIPNPQKKPFINHKNGNKIDNRIKNLEWCTSKENAIHAFKTGLKKMPYCTLGKTSELCVNSKPVIKMDLDGNFIEKFASATLAAASVGKKRAECIAHCARGESNTSAGFKWKYVK